MGFSAYRAEVSAMARLWMGCVKRQLIDEFDQFRCQAEAELLATKKGP